MKISHAYFINLLTSDVRRENATRQLSELNMPFEKFNAIDGTALNFTRIQDNKQFNAKDIKNNKIFFEDGLEYEIKNQNLNLIYKPNFKQYQKRMNRALRPEEIGCILSHLNVYLDIIQKNYEYALIFEDDFVINDIKKFKQELNYISSNLPADCDIFYLYSNYSSNKLFTWFSFLKKFRSKICLANKKPFASNTAYIINKQTAKLIVEDVIQSGFPILPIDFHITQHLQPKKNLKLYVYGLNDLITHGIFQSTVQTNLR